MPDNQYPVFDGGQTLTAADLNQLRAFTNGRSRLLGRLVGFGVNCGLGGVVTSTTLTIDGGLAIDQTGEPLILPAPQSIALPPALSSGSFDFVAPAAGGFSVVLESTDTAEPAPDCGEADCEGHAELHTRAVALRVVAGRITGPRFDFANETLLTVEPMRLSLTSAPQGSYVTLRDALVARLNNGGSPLINPALITKLQGTSIAPADLAGVKGYKAGFLNQVLFATLDLLRCRALMSTDCDRTTTRPGVVLGWVRLVGSAWVWDCAYRHAWEPPKGLSLALTGGGCSSPCGVWVDLVESLISGYAPPDPPPVEDDDDGPIIVFPLCPHGMILVGGTCQNIYYPPLEFPDEWAEPWHIDPLGPIWNPPDVYLHIDEVVTDLYHTDPWSYFGTEVIGGLPALGRDAGIAKSSFEAKVTELGGTPNVLVLTAAQAAAQPGYTPGASFNKADTIVLTAGTNNKVTALGRIPAAHSARELGTALPAVTSMATEALAATEVQAGGLQVVTAQVGGLAQDIVGFKGFQQTTEQWQKDLGATIEGQVRSRVELEIGNLRLDDMQQRLAVHDGQLDVIVRGVGLTRATRQLDTGIAQGMVEFAGSLANGLATLVTPENEEALGRHIGEATRATSTLEEAAAGGEPQAIGEAAVRLMGTLRTAIKSAGIDASLGKELDGQLNAMKGMLG
ncbi:hypothetical protein [Cellulomonas sp. Root137]|uniref:hypothetical protein n=1 Tax=Cellulomonas sp. Root137 TaxID=1736459 RepID=UPI0006FA47B7|nr:hypothetical protein [Cellulomonas sp. Root137]KQY42950.1 hypothetical protein ASD18_18430 [Cellulomonas sp. Root137]